MQVWKTPVKFDGGEARVPLSATPLHFAIQHGMPCIWWRIDDPETCVPRTWRTWIAGTGHDVRNTMHYVGSALTMNDDIVLHAFVQPPE